MKVAIVDDNKGRRFRIITSMLETYKVEYDVFKSVKSFLSAIHKNPNAYKGFFLDMQLPQNENETKYIIQNGGERILQDLLENDINIPFILTTMSYMSDKQLKKDIYKNMYEYIVGLGTTKELYIIYSFIQKLLNE